MAELGLGHLSIGRIMYKQLLCMKCYDRLAQNLHHTIIDIPVLLYHTQNAAISMVSNLRLHIHNSMNAYSEKMAMPKFSKNKLYFIRFR